VEGNSTVGIVIKSDSADEREQAKQARRAAAKLDKQLNTAPKRECIAIDMSDDEQQQLAGKAALAGPWRATSVVVPEQALALAQQAWAIWECSGVSMRLLVVLSWVLAAGDRTLPLTLVLLLRSKMATCCQCCPLRKWARAYAEMGAGLCSEGLWTRPSTAKRKRKKPTVLSKANFAAYKRSLQDRKKAPGKESKLILQRALKELDDKQAHATQDMLACHATHALAALTTAAEAGGSSAASRRSPRVCKADKLLHAEELAALK